MTPGRCGRLAHDPATFAAAPAHRFGALPVPAKLDRARYGLVPGLYNNDTDPDCTAASLANYARAVALLNDYDLVVEPGAPLAFYADCIGNPPDLAATDGAAMLDVLAHQGAVGFPIGPQSLVGRWGAIDPKSRSALASGIARLGAGWWGISLYERDMEMPAVWDVQPGRDDGALVARHAVIGWDYTGLQDADTVRIGTWGGWQPASWAWIAARLDEAYALVWRQLERAAGTFYAGVTADGLIAELA
jgi:hypothetical protein